MPTWDRHPDHTVLPIGDALKRHEAPSGCSELHTIAPHRWLAGSPTS